MTPKELFNISYNHPVILYDGICKLCCGFVQFMLRRDKKGMFRFVSLQDPLGVAMREELGLSGPINTVIGLRNGKKYTHSDVLYMVAIEQGGWMHILRPLYLLPKILRDLIYTWIARNRYSWFGKNDVCYIPSEEFTNRFLE